jgi:hypothetical protein
VTHLGQQLSALIDGELEDCERERVLMHLARCGSCRDEAAALRMLKRRMNALGEAAAGAGLTGRLMGLRDSALGGGMSPGESVWPPSPPPQSWQPPSQEEKPDFWPGRYFIAGSLVVFLAGLGTAAFIAGGDSQARAPAPPVTPSVLIVPHASMNGGMLPGDRELTANVRQRPGAGHRQNRRLLP